MQAIEFETTIDNGIVRIPMKVSRLADEISCNDYRHI